MRPSRGDIHDIGKNIVKVLLENYAYQVLDLGKDVPPEVIVDTAIKEDVPVVGLSALMTTTVVSMEETIKQLREKNRAPRSLSAVPCSRRNTQIPSARTATRRTLWQPCIMRIPYSAYKIRKRDCITDTVSFYEIKRRLRSSSSASCLVSAEKKKRAGSVIYFNVSVYIFESAVHLAHPLSFCCT